MKLSLTPEWAAILRRAWSIRFLALAAFFTAGEAALPFLFDTLPISMGAFALLSALSVAAAFVSRIVAQEGLRS